MSDRLSTDKNYQDMGDATLQAGIGAAKLFIAHLDARINELEKERAVWQSDLAALTAEKARRELGFTVGDELLPCAELEAELSERQSNGAIVPRSVISDLLHADTIKVVAIGDKWVEITADSVHGGVSYSIARAMRRAWLEKHNERR